MIVITRLSSFLTTSTLRPSGFPKGDSNLPNQLHFLRGRSPYFRATVANEWTEAFAWSAIEHYILSFLGNRRKLEKCPILGSLHALATCYQLLPVCTPLTRRHILC
ncbi:uncharacterized protein K460DRAFT_366442 [Cucurbitaria berberidis CBS 394.84]|uniref:Uncharacterized protein n=1 Tax=Cucurbitaria berberidis CBS 394.84 TaxID=1168544 RepID=A0A9P4GHL9_9PLEO|nr:uncharacterized protein K460DRAFT_366442 [Cucurbitaria berberidis CBS 394.84]KAF1845581.1 hypothetical protein K460DRAFT_366442 [Cucurbitaria berberidis CBS 394.84]